MTFANNPEAIPVPVQPVLPQSPEADPWTEALTITPCSVRSLTDTAFTLWGPAGTWQETGTEPQNKVQLELTRPVVIGRANGGRVPYLDPAYVSTSFNPFTGDSILLNRNEDTSVSRAHFQLKPGVRGVVLVNGVPHVGGGIRPPTNWTQLLAPQQRLLQPGEEYVIETGSSIQIRLPNYNILEIRAE